MKDKINKIRKLYEKAIEEENKFIEIYEGTTQTIGVLRDVALEQVHITTSNKLLLEEVLEILEK
jgi:hypothetical protein